MAARGRTACPWTLLREPRPGPSPSRPLRAGPMAPSGLRQVRAACLPGPYQHTAARVDGAAVHLLPAPQLCIMTGRSGDRAGSVERLQLGHRRTRRMHRVAQLMGGIWGSHRSVARVTPHAAVTATI
jgi:hypothetical protein